MRTQAYTEAISFRDIDNSFYISVTTNLHEQFGFELLVIGSEEIGKAMSTLIQDKIDVADIEYIAAMKNNNQTVYFTDVYSRFDTLLFTPLDTNNNALRMYLTRAGVPLNTKVFQYHPPVPIGLTSSNYTDYCFGHFPLEDNDFTKLLDSGDYRSMTH